MTEPFDDDAALTGGAATHMLSAAEVLRGQHEAWQVAWQIQPLEVPHQVPEDDGVLVHDAGRRHGLVALVDQQALQLLPQDQRAQVGHRRRSRPLLGRIGGAEGLKQGVD